MDERVPSKLVQDVEEGTLSPTDEDEGQERLQSFDSNCSEASDGSDQDSLGWLNAYANSTFEESSWISRKATESKEMTTEAADLRRSSMHTWFEEHASATERRSPKSQSPFLCYDQAEDEENGGGLFLHHHPHHFNFGKRCSGRYQTKLDDSKFITINKWLDSASHFLDVS